MKVIEITPITKSQCDVRACYSKGVGMTNWDFQIYQNGESLIKEHGITVDALLEKLKRWRKDANYRIRMYTERNYGKG